jgi:D-mannonate dehydratase
MSEPAKDFDLEHWKEVCYAHEAELQWLRADVKRMREALATFTEYQLATLEGLPAKTSKRERQRQQQIADKMVDACKLFGCYTKDRTPRLHEILCGQKERRAKALSDLAEMDADLLDIDPEMKP